VNVAIIFKDNVNVKQDNSRNFITDNLFVFNLYNMEKEKVTSVLNTLIKINNDRIEGYDTASKETKDVDLINLFFQFKETSKKCNTELISEVLQLGGKPQERTKIIGKFFRVWMDLKAALTNQNHNAILLSCDYGENITIIIYNKVLRKYSNELHQDHIRLIERQLILINKDLDSLRDMRDKLVALAINFKNIN
jgi:uncharacterized protein (TIGR02284 family)